MGNRPSTATGRPMIRQSRIKGLIYAFGHGHIGLASGPATGRMVAALAT
jgi:D-amino-acid dehydrogenase